MTQPLVTISFPVYEGDEYVAESIKSVLNQDYENLEIIIIDDCGKTNAMQIVRDCIERFPKKRNIRILRQPYNMKQGPARNRSLDEAKGEYIFFMDADDTITENCISLMVKTMLEEQVDFVEGSNRTQDGRFYTQNRCMEKQIVKGEKLLDSIFHDRLESAYYITNKLFNVKFLRKNNIRCTSPYFEDHHHAFLVFCKATSCIILPDVTYVYTIHDKQRSKTYRKEIPQQAVGIVRTFISLEYEILDKWDNPTTRERALLDRIKMGLNFLYKAFTSSRVSADFTKEMAKDMLSYPHLRKTDESCFTPYERKKHRYYRFLQSLPFPMKLGLVKILQFPIYKKKGV